MAAGIATVVPNRPRENRQSFSYLAAIPGISISWRRRLRVRAVTSVGAVVTLEVLAITAEAKRA
jgi:hypothetical protein